MDAFRNLKKTALISGALIVFFLIFAAGVRVGAALPSGNVIRNILHQTPAAAVVPEQVDFEAFWDAWSMLENQYVDIANVKRQDMMYGAISGLLKSTGDPYTVFFPPKENKEFQTEITGEFEGVGMEVGSRNGIITVVAPLKNTPAERAGILAGDKILKIDDTITDGLAVDEAVQKIRGQKGTKVKLLISRNGSDENKTIEITRDVIQIPVLDTASREKIAKSGNNDKNTKQPDLGDIFVIRLYNFSENSAENFRQALREMAEGGHKKLILDLRNNPGGFLDAAVSMASWFLPRGKVIVQEDFGGKTERKVHRSFGYDVFPGLPMVILVNQGSASASEILAGALRDNGVAKLIGERTFGKGSVQELLPLTSDTSLKITVAKWLTPNGISISAKGLDPDIEVKPTKEDMKAGRDPVMEKAIEVLKAMK